MRYVTLRIASAGESLHTIPGSAVPDSVGRGPVHRCELLSDGSIALLRSVTGDVDAYRRVLATDSAVHSFSVTDADPEGRAFVHLEPTEAVRSLLRWGRQFPVLVQPPVEFEGDDMVITLVGEVAAVSDATASLPDGLTYEVYETGAFVPSQSGLFRGLTARQREILATAVEMGYYQNPRGATQADLADEVSLSPGTVGDHLREVEAHVFSERTGLVVGPHGDR